MEEQNMGESSMPTMEGEGKSGGKSGKIIGLVIVVLVIALGVYALTRGSKETNNITPEAASTENEAAATAPEATASSAETTTPPVPETPAPETTAPTPKTVTVTFFNAGYSPSGVTINQGDSVMFKNGSATETWPASAMHPTHTVYPGSGIEKCGTAEQSGIFDACRGLKTGDTWTFQFNNVGKWNYHDHLNPTKFASVTVTE